MARNTFKMRLKQQMEQEEKEYTEYEKDSRLLFNQMYISCIMAMPLIGLAILNSDFFPYAAILMMLYVIYIPVLSFILLYQRGK